MIELITFFMIGVTLSFTPCVLPMVPIIARILSDGGNKLIHSVVYALSVGITYAISGIIVANIGTAFQGYLHMPQVIIPVGLLFLALGLAQLDLFGLSRLFNFGGWNHRLKNTSLFSVALQGIIGTLVLSPCVTPALVSILVYISSTGNVIAGGAYLFALGIGTVLPLLVVMNFGTNIMPKAGKWNMIVSKLIGIALIGMSLHVLYEPVKELIVGG